MKSVLFDLYLLGGAAALAGILALLGLAVNYGIGKVKWAKARAVLGAAWDVLDAVTREANAELLLKLKEAKDPDSDGGVEVTKAEWDAAKRAALLKFKRLYGVDKLGVLADALGLDMGGLSEWLGAKIAGGLDPR